jgi:hypothetical protein
MKPVHADHRFDVATFTTAMLSPFFASQTSISSFELNSMTLVATVASYVFVVFGLVE